MRSIPIIRNSKGLAPSVGYWQAAWILGTPVLWWVMSFAVFMFAPKLGFATNASGIALLFGHDISWFLCGSFPVCWVAVIVLTAKGRMPGTRLPHAEACQRCGYDLGGVVGPCPECGAE